MTGIPPPYFFPKHGFMLHHFVKHVSSPLRQTCNCTEQRENLHWQTAWLKSIAISIYLGHTQHINFFSIWAETQSSCQMYYPLENERYCKL